MSNLTTPQRDVLSGFRFTTPDDTYLAEKQIASTQAQLEYWQLVDAAYASEQADLMDLLDIKLEAKALAISSTAVVVYGSSHPNNAGIDPTDWTVVEPFVPWTTATPIVLLSTRGPFTVKSLDGTITYTAGVEYTEAPDTPSAGQTTLTSVSLPAQVRVWLGGTPLDVVYSHTVNWDSDTVILSYEDSWLELRNARINTYWGSTPRITSLTLAVSILNQWLGIIQGREQAAVDNKMRSYLSWVTQTPMSTRQPVFEVTTVAENQVFVKDTHYTVTPADDDPGLLTVEAIEDANGASLLPATVRVRVP